jgi:hypothetical protein
MTTAKLRGTNASTSAASSGSRTMLASNVMPKAPQRD